MAIRSTSRITLLAAALVASTLGFTNAFAAEATVYKSKYCGCCKGWISHLTKNGFQVKSNDVENLPAIKKQYKVPDEISSCHTAIIDGYVVEGHVPASTIKRLLKERPKVVGIAAPGMPLGSPGMESPNAEPYEVVTFDANGKTELFETVDPASIGAASAR